MTWPELTATPQDWEFGTYTAAAVSSFSIPYSSTGGNTVVNMIFNEGDVVTFKFADRTIMDFSKWTVVFEKAGLLFVLNTEAFFKIFEVRHDLSGQ